MAEERTLDRIVDELGRDKNKLLSAFFEKYSLDSGRYNILFDISCREGISQQAIADIRNVDKSAAARSIKGLVENGYVRRERDKSDKRAYCLYCTEKGKAMIPTIERVVSQANSILADRSSTEEIRLFKDICLRMCKNVAGFLAEIQDS